MSKFFNELKRRNVIKESIAYLVIAWVLLEVVTMVLPIVGTPSWVLKTFTFFLAIGFPIWIIFSWVYEVTPTGIKKTSKKPLDQSKTVTSNKRLNILIIIGLAATIAISFFNKSTSNNPLSKTTTFLTEKSIAVLPFEDLSSGGDTEWFCDGVTEDIRTNLSKIKGINKVISYTSVMQYKENRPTIPEIAEKLGVSYVLEGSVRKHKDKIIITAQLIDANDRHIWGDNYNNNFDKIFEIQYNVSKKIVQQLQIAMSPEEEKLFY
jgi:TolB-like protein